MMSLYRDSHPDHFGRSVVEGVSVFESLRKSSKVFETENFFVSLFLPRKKKSSWIENFIIIERGKHELRRASTGTSTGEEKTVRLPDNAYSATNTK